MQNDFDGSWTVSVLKTSSISLTGISLQLFESELIDVSLPVSLIMVSAGLMTSIADQIHAALAHHVSSEAANAKRIRQVGLWGVQRGAEVLLDTLRNVVDPVHAQLLATV